MIKIANNLVKLAEKSANPIQNVVQHLEQKVNPLEQGLFGAAGGGITGAALGVLIEQLKEEKKRQYLKAMLLGGGLGAGVGGFFGAGNAIMNRNELSNIVNHTFGGSAPSDEMNKALAEMPKPLNLDSILGGNSGSALINDPNATAEQLLAPRGK
jgi:hypothetical protein